jgi:hypothetical protein
MGALNEVCARYSLRRQMAAILAKAASVLLAAPLGNRTLFDRIKFVLKFRDHQLEPLAQCGIDHRSGQAFGAGDFGKGTSTSGMTFTSVAHSLPATVPRTKMPKSQRRRERKSLRTQGTLM